MYFIPRNNMFYHHVAHISALYRYLCTFFFASLVMVVWFYGFYSPLEQRINAHHVIAKQLVIQSDQHALSMHTSKDLTQLIDVLKTDLSANASLQNMDEYFKVQTLYVMDVIKKTGLRLDKYSVQQEKNKLSYKKNKAQLVVSGKFESIMNFLETIKLSQKLITIGSLAISFVREDIFALRCDVGFAFVTHV